MEMFCERKYAIPDPWATNGIKMKANSKKTGKWDRFDPCWFAAVWIAIVAVAGCGGRDPEKARLEILVPAIQSQPVAQTPTSSPIRSSGFDWPVFLGPQGDGTSAETGILTDWSDGKLKVVWNKELGEGYGIGTVAAGRYFQFDRNRDQARVRCFQAETGADLWVFEYPSNYRDLYGYDSGPRTSPIVDGDRVYIFGAEGMIFCLTTDTGKVVWQLDTTAKFGVIQNFFGVASTPVIAGDRLLVMVGGSPPESKTVPPGALDRVQPNGSGIVSIDKMTGEVQYQIANDLASYSTIKLAELGGRPVAYAWLRGSLIGFETATGKTFLDFPFRSPELESVNASTPVVKSTGPVHQILISECYGLGSVLLSIDAEQVFETAGIATVNSALTAQKPDAAGNFSTGINTIWSDKKRRQKSLEAHWNTPILVGSNLYGCSGRHAGNAELRCIDWETGVVRWSVAGFERSSLTGIDGHFVLLDEAGRLVLLKANPDRYEEVTEYAGEIKLKPPCWAAPIISRGLMYVRGRGQMVCFELIPLPDKDER